MKIFIYNYLTFLSKRLLPLCTILLIFILIISNNSWGKVKMVTTHSWSNLKYAIYFTHGDIENLLADSIQFKKTMEYFAPVKAYKVYLEGNSQNEIDTNLLKKVSNRFREMGINVSGSMVPVSSKGGPSTYNNADDLASLKKRMQALAQVFDTIILDDWLFTTATDLKSVEDRGNQSWADYRTKLLLEQSKKYIIDAAKEINPKVELIIKYPNWYEGHRQNGYDVLNETKQFDKMAVGIETRIPETQDQHIPIYSGYVFQKWFASVNTSKWIGSWLDNYDMKGGANDYTAQVWQAVLAKAPEIILWCAGQLYPTGPSSDIYSHFVDMLPEFDRAAGLLKGTSRGVPMYLPYGSTGEYNIFGYLGMAGIPIDPAAQFPGESQNAIFTLHSLFETTPVQLADRMLSRLKKGNDIFLTWDLWKKLQDTEFKNTLSLINYGGTVSSNEFRIREGWFRQETIKADKPFSFPRIETTTWPYVRNTAVVKEDYDYAVLMQTQYMTGSIYILNMPHNSYDLLQMPVEALNSIRESFSQELGVTLQGPGKVAMYLFGQNQYALYNMSNETAPVSLRFTKELPAAAWKELLHNEQLSIKQDSSYVRFGRPVQTDVSLTVQPFEITIVQAP